MTKILLKTGADVDARTEGGRTALHCAASTGHRKVAKLLLAAGADIKTVPKKQKSERE